MILASSIRVDLRSVSTSRLVREPAQQVNSQISGLPDLGRQAPRSRLLLNKQQESTLWGAVRDEPLLLPSRFGVVGENEDLR